MIKITGDCEAARKLRALFVEAEGDLEVHFDAGGWTKGLNCIAYVNGLRQLERYRDASVPTVEFTEDVAVARRWVREGSLVFGRDRVHEEGTDIVGPQDERWSRKDFWSKVVPEPLVEWRVQVFCGKRIGQGLKFQEDRAKAGALPIRNRRTGWKMTHGIVPPIKVELAAIMAVKALGYDFAAVDTIWKEATREVFVLESNRCPGMDDWTVERYREAIVREARRG